MKNDKEIEELKEDLLLSLPPSQIKNQDIATLTRKDDKYEFTIKMFESDQGKPHINVFTKNGKLLLYKVLLVDNLNDINDIKLISMHLDLPDSTSIKNMIFEWANDTTRGVKNIIWAECVWDAFHDE